MSFRDDRAVHWDEGMFLSPHHFQAAQRHVDYTAHLRETWDQPYFWGLRAIDLDLEALANHRVVVHALEARMRDGTLVKITSDLVLPDTELKAAFADTDQVTVLLAVPRLQSGRSNTASDPTQDIRYVMETDKTEDENRSSNMQSIQYRQLNLRLLLSHKDPAGFETLPLARVRKSSLAKALPELDPAYIPPLLAASSWSVLRVDILQNLYDRIGAKMDILAPLIIGQGIAFESQGSGDRARLEQLRILNEAYALLGNLAFVEGVHPLPIYLELCRLVGQLAILHRDTCRPPKLPLYDHDDLGHCFRQLRHYIDALLNEIILPNWEARPFIGQGLRMEVSLQPAWLEQAWQMYVQVESDLTEAECVRLLTGGVLNMKIGSSERVDRLFTMGADGLRFNHVDQLPRDLRRTPRLTYFQVSRELQQAEWEHVRRSLTLAIRLNETNIASKIDKAQSFEIRAGGKNATLRFTLYVVKPEK